MNEIYEGKSKTATLPPIQIQTPTMNSVLDMLNIINGILFVQISQRDIENFKTEYEKRAAAQKSTPSSTEAGEADSSEAAEVKDETTSKSEATAAAPTEFEELDIEP